MSEKSGLNAAVKSLPTERAESFAADRQSMLPLVPAIPTDQAGEPAPAADPGARGPGRPPGSRNKATKEAIAYYQALGYHDPMLFLLETFNRPAAALAAELGCKTVEAFDRQIAAARELMSYWHQKQPVQIESEAGLLNIVFQAAPGTLQASGIDPMALPPIEMFEDEETEQNQEVTNPPQVELDKPELDK